MAKAYRPVGLPTSRCIVELFDKRLGQTVFEVHAKNQDTGNSWLIAECNTKADARNVIRRRQEVSDG